MIKTILQFCLVAIFAVLPVGAQSLGNAGTVDGTVVDPSGGLVSNAEVILHNVVTGYTQSARSGTDGTFRLNNIPLGVHHLEVKAPGFNTYTQSVDIRNSLPIPVKSTLSVAG